MAIRRPRKKATATAVEPTHKKVIDYAPQIVKCSGDGCDKKETCNRFTSKPSPSHQSYFTECVAIPDKSKCRFFMEIPE